MIRILVPVLAALLFAGCGYTPGGPLRSNDQFTYQSTVHEPVNVALVDSRTEEVIWSMEVPVGQKVTVRFYPNQTEGYEDYPDIMKWELQENSDFNERLRSTIPVPDRWSRRLEISYREGPEYYTGAAPQTQSD